MKPVQIVHGLAVGLEMGSVDTDQIVPARYLYRNRSDGFADTLFHDMRSDSEGREQASFPLNGPQAGQATILVALDNFGCGSSREHAVWALIDAGFQAVIAVSFGDIFRNNAHENGLLPVVLEEHEVMHLLQYVRGGPEQLTVDLETQRVTLPDGTCFSFGIDSAARENLLLGRSKIDETRSLMSTIDAFEKAYLGRQPWSE